MFKKILFFTLFLAIPVFYTIWTGEHEPVKSGEEIEKQVEAKQQDVEKQREQKAQAETAYREAEQREREAQEKLNEQGYTGYLASFWGGSEYNTLLEEKNNAINEQEDAEKNINAAQKKIEQLQQEMVALAQQYTPQTSTQDLVELQDKMNQILKEKQPNINAFNETLQQVIAKSERADKFAVLTNAVEDLAKAYPNDLIAQVEGLKKIELTLNLMFAKDSKLPAFSGAQRNIDEARAKVQAKIDERSPWYGALKADPPNISTFKTSLADLYRKKKTDEERKFLLRDVFNQISANLEVGSTKWFDALDGMFIEYALGIPTEKAGIDLKEELLNSAVDLVNAKLKPGSEDWVQALNTLYEYDDPLGSKEVQKRITNELRKEEVKTHAATLNDLLKEGDLADYENTLQDSLAKLDAPGKIVLINNQYSTAVGQYGVNNYQGQVDVLSALSSAVDPANFVPFYKETAQSSHDKISGRLEVLEDRVELKQENLSDTLRAAGNDAAQSSILDEEVFTAKGLHIDVPENPKAGYAAQEAFLTDLAKTAEEFKGSAFTDLSRTDIANRLDEIKKFDPQKPATFINDLEKNIWNLLPNDQVTVLQTLYNENINQLTKALENNNVAGVEKVQNELQKIKDLIDKYTLTKENEVFAGNVDAGIEFAKNALEASKPIELTAEEKSVLTKVTSGEALNESEAALLAGIGAKKVLSFVATNLTPENLASADKVAAILAKAPLIANITGKVMQGVGKVIDVSNNWYVKTLFAGPTLIAEHVAAPLAKRIIKAQYGENMVKALENTVSAISKSGQAAAEKIPDLVAFTNSDQFKKSAEALETSGNVIGSATGLFKDLAANINLSADAKNTANIPPKEIAPTHDAVSALARRLEEFGAFDPDTSTQPAEINVPEEKKGFFAQIKDYFSSFVADVKRWVTSLFAGDTGILSLEKKFATAQEAYNTSKTDANARALAIAAQNLHAAYQEVIGSVVMYKELGNLLKNVVTDKAIAEALKKDPINMAVLNEAATALLKLKNYNATFINAMNEINQAVKVEGKDTALADAYPKLFNDLVMADYAQNLSQTQQEVQNLNEAFTHYKSKLQDVIAKTKQPSTPEEGIPASGQQTSEGILGQTGN